MRALSLFLTIFMATPLFAAQARGNAQKGQDLYLEKCVLCHGSQGEGWDWSKKVISPPIPVPDLSKPTENRSDQFLFDIVKGGGEAVGKTRFMPPFGFQLDDQDAWDLVAYIRTLGGNAK
jgi:mono/diheme cytochrome c family protein